MDRLSNLPDGLLEKIGAVKGVIGPLSQCSRTLYTRLALMRLEGRLCVTRNKLIQMADAWLSMKFNLLRFEHSSGLPLISGLVEMA